MVYIRQVSFRISIVTFWNDLQSYFVVLEICLPIQAMKISDSKRFEDRTILLRIPYRKEIRTFDNACVQTSFIMVIGRHTPSLFLTIHYSFLYRSKDLYKSIQPHHPRKASLLPTPSYLRA